MELLPDLSGLPVGAKGGKQPQVHGVAGLSLAANVGGEPAVLLIAEVKRPALIHVPTIDLMHQWHSVLTTHLGGDIGLLGGGYKELRDITVTTYDSALLHATARGNRFGFAIFDECHHLPGDQYRFAAISSIAPFRLGLTATPERADGRHIMLDSLLGPIA